MRLRCVYTSGTVTVVPLQWLRTLPRREFANGMSEVLKAAAILDEPLFQRLTLHAEDILACDMTLLLPIIREAIQLKARIVSADERESGIRAVLNYGHTIGHAIEALMQACQ